MTIEEFTKELEAIDKGEPTDYGKWLEKTFGQDMIDFYWTAFQQKGYGLEYFLKEAEFHYERRTQKEAI